MDANRIKDAFRARYGAYPKLMAAAPGRINLIGEHTDYNDGYVLPAAIDREAVVALRQNGLGKMRLFAYDLNEEVIVDAADLVPHQKQWANYLLGVVVALRKRGHAVPAFDCVLSCDVPQGSGLSSSAAIECALATGINALYGLRLDKWTLAEVGQAAENDFVGANTGILDQFASVFGEENTALLLDCRSRTVTFQSIRLPRYRLVVLNTGVKHNHLTSGYGARRADCERAVQHLRQAGWQGKALRDTTDEDLLAHADKLDALALQRASFVVAENTRVLTAVQQLKDGDVAGFGSTLLAGHWGLSELYEVSCPESDALVRFAEAHPAVLGARQMGGGFGGCVLFMVEQESVAHVIAQAQSHYQTTFNLPLEDIEVTLGPGARVL